MLLRVADENTPLRRETRTQQNSDVKFRSSEKNSSKKDLDKSTTNSSDLKPKGRTRNSPCPPVRSRTSEKLTQSGRKRSVGVTGETSRKRLKVS